MKSRKSAYRRGIIAEWYCMLWLMLKGYSILALRYKHFSGEIDIIAVKARMLVCVEVKARANKTDALLSVTPQKQYRSQQAALAFKATHAGYAQHDLRFDVMVVTSRLRIIHLVNAWSAS